MPAQNNFIMGHEYDLGNGTSAVWGGKKGWMTPDAYMKQKGEGQDVFDVQSRLMKRLDEGERASNKWDATGFMGGLESKFKVGGTAGYDLDQTLNPVRANAFIRALTEMRANSPTGGAVGNVTEGEGEKLASTDATLNVGQSRDQLQREIRTMREAMSKKYVGLSDTNPYDLATTNPAEIPQGAYFRAKDGNVYQNKKGAGPPRDDPVYNRQLATARGFRGSTSKPGTAGNPWLPRNEAAYRNLPAGSYYIHPDGDVRRKK